mmetsp:Transcript_3783/g.8467  ORF Transcript_3783/g.8467 Transcript_3783/m.8467 type:complete len:221 (-) Transcript_3783:241-903(-)
MVWPKMHLACSSLSALKCSATVKGKAERESKHIFRSSHCKNDRGIELVIRRTCWCLPVYKTFIECCCGVVVGTLSWQEMAASCSVPRNPFHAQWGSVVSSLQSWFCARRIVPSQEAQQLDSLLKSRYESTDNTSLSHWIFQSPCCRGMPCSPLITRTIWGRRNSAPLGQRSVTSKPTPVKTGASAGPGAQIPQVLLSLSTANTRRYPFPGVPTRSTKTQA